MTKDIRQFLDKTTVFTFTILLVIMFLMIRYILNLEPVDYIQLTQDTMNSPEQMQSIEEVRRNAFEYAKSCSGINTGIEFEDIKWFIYPDREIRFQDERNYLDLAGWYDRENEAIWIAYPYRRVHWVNAHESLHALGIVGHGVEFANCNLLLDQQD
tara:strand:- start:397 stop:864 length:468 start_codon:yes stop_codon:yes gene_type:complete